MASITVCDASSKHSQERRIEKLASIVSAYGWIIDAYVSDFYTKEFWSRLPSSLQKYFDAIQAPDLAWLLYSYNGQPSTCCRPTSTIPPLSLLALRQCISLFALQRTAVDTESEATQKAILTTLGGKDHIGSTPKTNNTFPTCMGDQMKPATAGRMPNYKNGQNMDMQHVFRKHVKPKKQHEINSLGQIINLLSRAAESRSVVDVGAGLGHLARLLAFQHGLQVTTIEAAGGHAPKASELDKDLRKNIHKAKIKQGRQTLQQQQQQAPSSTSENPNDSIVGLQYKSMPLSKREECRKGGESESSLLSTGSERLLDERSLLDDDAEQAELPCHVICTVQPDIAASQFIEILAGRSGNTQPEEAGSAQFVLAGLHACGDLTPTLLRVFLNCPTARGLASVACCYMKMSATRSPNSLELENFPMSSYLQTLPVHSLSYEAREMACHFVDAYYQRLKENPPHLKIHSYRAALQLLVTTVDPTFRSGQARLISKKGANGTFTQYAAENLKKLNISMECVPQALLDECEGLTQQWMRVVAFYTLRLSLAPLVESLMLCDRALFLLEHGIPSVLVPIFDSHISPRNFALLACKP